MRLRLILILFFLSVVSAVAGVIPGFEPVWEEPEPVTKPSSSITKEDLVDRKTVRKKGFTDSVTGMEFVWVPGGCYQMGCESNSKYSGTSENELPASIADIPAWQWPLAVVAALLPVGCARPSHYKSTGCYSDEQPVHEVCVDGFYIGKHEVTQGQYQKITGSNPSSFNKGSKYPVEKVSWDDANSYIKKLNSRSNRSFRLPTEAEWEYAARSGGKREKYAGSNSIDSVAWYSSNSGSSTHPVGRKTPNGLGLYDMSGNVWEWCLDRYDSGYYSSSPRNNPQGPSSSSRRVIRGGSWSNGPAYVRAAGRFRGGAAYRYDDVGFRLVSSGQ